MKRFLALLVLPLCAQEKASVEGLVVNSVTTAPVRRAVVQLLPVGPGNPTSTTSDAEGMFTFPDVAPGSYRLVTSHPNYPPTVRFMAGLTQQITLEAGERKRGLSVKLAPGGAVTGRVTDEDGDPAVNCGVALYELNYNAGRRMLMSLNGATTNDRGEYRISGVRPGRFYVHVRTRSRAYVERPLLPTAVPYPAPAEAWIPLYYPDAPEFAAATPIGIEPGAEVQGIDFRLRKVRVFSLSGRIDGVSEPQAMQVSLYPKDSMLMGADVSHSAVRNGMFEFQSLPPGSYILRAGGTSAGKVHTIKQSVEIGERNIANLTLTLLPSADIRGIVRFETQPQSGGPQPQSLQVALHPADAEPALPNAPVNAMIKNGSFQLANVAAGEYRVQLFGVPAFVKSATMGGQSISAERFTVSPGATGPLEIVVSFRTAELSGTVEGPMGSVVLVIPEGDGRFNPQAHQVGVTSPQGTFQIVGLRPGRYRVAAIAGIEPSQHGTPEVIGNLDAISQAITLEEGGKHTMQLKATALP
jgi:hypothetical protein